MAESIPIETLKITVTSSGAGQVRKNLEEVAAGLKAVRDSVKGGTDQVGNIVERLKLLISAISDLDGDKVDKLARLGDALSKLKAGTVGSSSEAVFNKIANGIKTISDAAKDIKNLEALERLADVLERLKAVGFIKMGISGTKSVAKAAKEAEDAGIGMGDGGAGGEADKLDKEKLKQLKKDLKEADSVLASLKSKYLGWIKAITRIALYRAIRSVIKSIMQSLNDGLEHFYQYSVKVNGLYATARAEIKTSMHYVSDALGAAAGQLIEKIYPVVVRILDATAHIFNNISEMIAYLSGEETYTRAVRGIADINAEAKKLKATLLGFDEINKLNGSGGSGSDEYGHFEEAVVNKQRAEMTSTIVGGIGAFLVGSKILSIAEDIGKLTKALGVKGLAGAAETAGKSFGTWGTGENGAGGSGLLGVLGRLAAGVGAAISLKFGDLHFENMLAAEESDQKVLEGIQAALGGIGAVALGYAAGGIPGVVITIGAMIKMVVDDIVLDDNTRNKVKDEIEEFGDSLPGNDYGDYAREDLEKVGEDLDRYAESMQKATSFWDKVDAWFNLNGDLLAHGLSAFGDTIDARTSEGWNNVKNSFTNSDPNWTWRQGVTDLADYYGFDIDPGSSDINVIVELDGEVLARGVSNAGNKINYRGGNYDELR